jgi:hypothetical protein
LPPIRIMVGHTLWQRSHSIPCDGVGKATGTGTGLGTSMETDIDITTDTIFMASDITRGVFRTGGDDLFYYASIRCSEGHTALTWCALLMVRCILVACLRTPTDPRSGTKRETPCASGPRPSSRAHRHLYRPCSHGSRCGDTLFAPCAG